MLRWQWRSQARTAVAGCVEDVAGCAASNAADPEGWHLPVGDELPVEGQDRELRQRGARRDRGASRTIWWTGTRRTSGNSSHPAADETGQAPAPAIDPELLKEEADRAALTPEVAPDLKLPEEDSVLALDYFHGTPELVPLVQSDGELNRTTSHNILKLSVNPRSASHQIVQLKGTRGARSDACGYAGDLPARGRGFNGSARRHTAGGGHAWSRAGAMKAPSNGSANSGYVMVRADVRTDARVLASFNIGMLGSGVKQQEDVVETVTETLPGGHWMKVTPKRPLDFGEYALMEVISEKEINMGVWDFGVHPVAPENRDVLKPQPKRPASLERR